MDESRLSGALKEAVPQPPRAFVFAPRSRTRWVAPAVTATATAAVSIAVVILAQHDTRPVNRGAGPPPSPITQPGGCPESRPYRPGINRPAVLLEDSVYLYGRTYRRWPGTEADPTSRSDLGPVVASVNCSLGDLIVDRGRYLVGQPRDGNSTALPVGTDLHAVDGYAPQCRVAAVTSIGIRTYAFRGEASQFLSPEQCEMLLSYGATPSP